MAQIYEKYWQLTLEYSDYTSYDFNTCLQIIVDFIDKNDTSIYSKELYKNLQEKVFSFNPKRDDASVRKSINQFLKLGFVNNFLQSYHHKTKEFLSQKDSKIKKRIYSEIMYDNASFSRSVKNPCNNKEINFLIKTLEHCGRINKTNLSAIMIQDVTKKPYLTYDELQEETQKILQQGFQDRKYNQVNYLWDICKNILVGIYLDSEYLTLEKPELSESEKTIKARDSYKQTLYKYDLYNESLSLNNEILCFVEAFKFPSLIASHIKPYIECEMHERFDSNNGLLLSKNMDYLFDNGWISFDNDGNIICATNLDSRLKKYLGQRKLDKKYLNPKRLYYLEYHRKHIFNRTKCYKF